MPEEFSPEVIDFCVSENYHREGPVTEEEFSRVAHKLYGIFFMKDLSLDRIVEVTNCALLARIRKK